jgi:hypothetical protein
MGKFDGKYLRGAVGDVIFKKVRGQQIVQGKSKKAKTDQSAETKKAATVFGRASNLAAYIRVALDASIGFYDGAMISRLTGEVNQVAHTSVIPESQTFDFTSAAFSRLNGFEFNITSPVRNQISVQPLVSTTDNLMHIDLPEIHIPRDLKFHKDGSYCVLGFQVALFDLQHGYYDKSQGIQTTEIKYDYQTAVIPAKQFNFQTEPGCLCIISIAIQYYEKTFSGNSVVNNKTFNPSAILKAFLTEGAPDPLATKKWQPMAFKTT